MCILPLFYLFFNTMVPFLKLLYCFFSEKTIPLARTYIFWPRKDKEETGIDTYFYDKIKQKGM